jgi:outer membrane immunogenic protein
MSRGLIGATALAMSLAAQSALAADLPAASPYYQQPVPYTAAYSWTGPYLGATLGYQWGSVGGLGNQPNGFIGGIEGGYNWQFGQFVLGAEADLTLSGADDVFAAFKFSNPWFGTVRGRAGYAFNNILVYGTLGFAFGDVEAQSTITGVSQTQTHWGWVGGLGMEVGFTPNWTAKVEYLYVDLSGRVYGLAGLGTHDLDSSILRLGVNYRF